MRYHARDMAVVRARSARHPDRAGVGDALGRDRGQCAARPLPPPASARALRRRSICPPSRRSTCAPKVRRAAASSRRGSPRRCRPRSSAASRRCCSSIAAAMRRSRSAAQCGFRLACPNCDAWLVDHRFRRRLVCHHCGFAMPPPAQCPKCQATDSFVAVRPRRRAAGAGGGGAVSGAAASSCCRATWSNRSSACARSWTTSPQGRVDIVIGTQLVAKGHHFPKLNLVGVVDADLGLEQRRSARGRAHVPAAASGRRAAPAARRAAAQAICRPTSPSIR